MLRIDRQNNRFQPLTPKPLPEAGIGERSGLQLMIRSSPDAFFKELGEKILLLDEEVAPSDVVGDRIDLLGLDEDGAVVIIELKRGSHKLQLLQAMSYAAMMDDWDRERLAQCRARLTGCSLEDAKTAIDEFVGGDADVNTIQRLVLIAENFDYSVLVTAEWLTEKYGLNIRCYRIGLASDPAGDFLACERIYPPRELEQSAMRRGRSLASEPQERRWNSWEEVLKDVDNPAVAEFFQKELAAGRDGFVSRKELRYSVDGRRRLFAYVRSKFAYARQRGRFDGDEAFWRSRLSGGGDVAPVRKGQALRFRLASPQDFTAFTAAWQKDLVGRDFIEPSNDADDLDGPPAEV